MYVKMSACVLMSMRSCAPLMYQCMPQLFLHYYEDRTMLYHTEDGFDDHYSLTRVSYSQSCRTHV